MSAVPLVLLALAAGCKSTAVSGVQLTPPAAALAAGEKTAIQVVIEPENATVQTVT